MSTAAAQPFCFPVLVSCSCITDSPAVSGDGTDGEGSGILGTGATEDGGGV